MDAGIDGTVAFMYIVDGVGAILIYNDIFGAVLAIGTISTHTLKKVGGIVCHINFDIYTVIGLIVIVDGDHAGSINRSFELICTTATHTSQSDIRQRICSSFAVHVDLQVYRCTIV